jgi:peptide/nickel transport system ATP-binding protein
VEAYSIIGLLQSPGKVIGGSITFEGEDLLAYTPEQMRQFRGNKVSMIFQNPMTCLNPVYTIGNQLMEALLCHDSSISREEAWKRSVEMLDEVGINNPEKRMKQYPHEFSGGMLQRALIAMALVCNPSLLIADEPTTALDVTIQAQILELMKDMQKEFNMAILFITHDLGVVAKMCDRVAVMYLGKIVESGTAEKIYANPQHPYTRGLMGSVHKIGGKKTERLFSIEGTVPLAMNLPNRCGFYDRCDSRIEGLCDKADPTLVDIEGQHQIACFACQNEACKKMREEAEKRIKAEESGAKEGV